MTSPVQSQVSQLSSLLRQPLLTTNNNMGHICASMDDCEKIENASGCLFPSFRGSSFTLQEKIMLSLERYKNNYYVDWTESKIQQLETYLRPLVPVTKDLWKTTLLERTFKYDVSLHLIIASDQEWAAQFKEKLNNPNCIGGYKTLCDVKTEAFELCTRHASTDLICNIDRLARLTIPSQEPILPSRLNLKRKKVEAPINSEKIFNLETGSNVTTIERFEQLGDIFQPIPRTINLFGQLQIWRERHRCNFYLNYSSEEMGEVNIQHRPKVVINESIYKQYVTADISRLFSKIGTIINSASTYRCTTQFVEAIKSGYYNDISTILIKSDSVWNDLQNEMNNSRYDDRHVLESSHLTKLEPFRADYSPYTPSASSPRSDRSDCNNNHSSASTVVIEGQRSSPHVFSSWNDSPVSCATSPERESSPGTCSYHGDASQILDDTSGVLDLSQKENPNPTLVDKLWSLRATLQTAFQLQVTDTWHSKLEKHLPLLRKHLGRHYKLPQTVEECMADMTLITLHAEVQHYQF